MSRRAPLFLFAVVLLAAPAIPSGAAGEVPLLPAAMQQAAPPAVVLYNPDHAGSLALLDTLVDDADAGALLAVCVGDGCDAATAARTADERGWPFRLAFDPGGGACERMLGRRDVPAVVRLDGLAAAGDTPIGVAAAGFAGSRDEERTHTVAARAQAGPSVAQPTAAQPAGATAAAGALSSFTPSPEAARFVPSPRQALLLGVPLVMLGIGGAALVLGSRRNGRSRDEDDEERARIEQHIRTRHGRKPVRR